MAAERYAVEPRRLFGVGSNGLFGFLRDA